MSTERAWKDPDYRDRLTEDEAADMPENPAGTSPLDNRRLNEIHGGTVVTTRPVNTVALCPLTLVPSLCGTLGRD
ncbi:mersacidin/lichenicidin family type 2 lantibiotic [Nocardiopsis alborubida]|uniref:Mersacidin/lichenicidin family type 2 lantibiotic n=1 Tax=Nocardiopsis alborubida TaxID=146802 RepID=A0A7X6MHV0_9ACTN|nr:mersacidin/lichenicidin family type 2 lantibiotic [Nocardiopsis alborubida]NKZ01882.1 mersacidin/lichenicidin family type 2 lantibiotic [Nocardiopsis alborubida]